MRIEWLREQLDKQGKTQRALAEYVGLDESQMSKVMSGVRSLSADEAARAYNFLGYRLPDNPLNGEVSRILAMLPRLSASQERVVALYLEALLDEHQEPSTTSR